MLLMDKPKMVDEIVVTVRALRAKRITPWGAFCNSCGYIGAGKNKKRGVRVGVDHANAAHRGQATLRTF